MRALEAYLWALLICSSKLPTGTTLNLFCSVQLTSQPKSDQLTNKWRWYRWEDKYTSGVADTSRQHKLRSKYSYKATTAATADEFDITEFDGLTRSELQAMCKRLQLRAVGKTCELVSRLREHQRKRKQQHEERDQLLEKVTTHTHHTKDPPSPSSEELIVDVVSEEHYSPGSSFALDLPGTSAIAVQPQLSYSAVGPDRYRKHFPELADEQWAMVERLGELLAEWNGRMNLISRRDIENVMSRHVVPCLAMAKAIKLQDGVNVLDVGTGGGLPGLPMAIYYPQVEFTLIDGTGKKIHAVHDMAERLGLTNVRAFHTRAEDVHELFDFIIGRAVASLPKFVGFVDKNLKRNASRNTMSTVNGDDDGVVHVEVEKSSPPLKRGVLYMRGEIDQEELDELGARPSTVLSLEHVLEERRKAATNIVADGPSDRGYSSVFHFTSEAIWNRAPRTADAIHESRG